VGSKLSPASIAGIRNRRFLNDLWGLALPLLLGRRVIAMSHIPALFEGDGMGHRARRPLAADGGFTLVELLVVISLLVIVAAISAPFYLSYQRAQETNGAARELVTALNQARQLAITRSSSFSVESQANPQNRLRLCSGAATPCPGGTVWMGPEADSAGWRVLDNGSRITQNPRITFSSLGAASATGSLRVQNSSGTGCLDVVVSPSGRIQITGSAACP
jgi:prepilin-type N-terminal cleavage/methylation domain-containing protein